MVMTSEGPILSWYWYRVGGVDTFSPIYAKLLEVPAFLARRRTSEFIALSTACEPDDCRDAFRTMASFMGVKLQRLPGDGEEKGHPLDES